MQPTPPPAPISTSRNSGGFPASAGTTVIAGRARRVKLFALGDHEARAGTRAAGPVVGIVKRAFAQRQAAAADAIVQPIAGALKLRDARVDAVAESGADPLPIGGGGRSPLRQAAELGGDLGERQAELLRDHRER